MGICPTGVFSTPNRELGDLRGEGDSISFDLLVASAGEGGKFMGTGGGICRLGITDEPASG